MSDAIRLDAADRVRAAFGREFPDAGGATAPIVVRAPGRVNLIGEHTDYNQGFVLPMALPHSTWIAARPRGDRQVVLHSDGYGVTRLDLDAVGPGRPVDGWGIHVAGALWALREAGVPLVGFEGTVATDVPVGASLSSSAALEVATVCMANALADQPFDPVAAALAGQRAEGEFLGLPSGIMDQLVSAAAHDGHALLIDCRDLSLADVPIPARATVVILDTMSRRELAESQYAARRRDCEAAADALGVDSLRDATLDALDGAADAMGERVTARARHVITETARTERAADLLRSGDVEGFGAAMNDSHASLRDLFEVSGPQLDTMVDIAQATPGVFGARMTGGGFAGAAVALVDTDRLGAFTDAVGAAYARVTGVEPRLYAVRPGPGAGMA